MTKGGDGSCATLLQRYSVLIFQFRKDYYGSLRGGVYDRSRAAKRLLVVHDGTLHGGGAVDVTTAAAEALDADLIVGYSGQSTEWWQSRTTADIEILMDSQEHSFIRDLKVKRFFRLSILVITMLC